MILPSVGTVSPARQLKKVDLPAPFGPISPTISPSSTDRSASRTAKKLPNAFETLCASRSIFAPPAPRCDTLPQLEQSSRFVARNEHDDPTVENERETRAAAAEPGVGRGLQRNQNKRTDERAIEFPGTAQCGNDDHLYGYENSETAFRIDETSFDRVKRASECRENGAKDECLDFYLLYRNTETSGSTFAGFDRPEIITKTAPLDQEGETKQDRQDGQKDIVIRQFTAEGQIPPAARRRRALQPDCCTDQIPRAEVNSDQLGDGNCGHAEVVTGQAKRGNADQHRERDAAHDAERNPGNRCPSKERVSQERCVGAAPEEHRVADRNLACVPTDDIPGRGRYRGQQKRYADVEIERSGKNEWVNQQARRKQNGGSDGWNFHALPIRPCGRNQSSATNSAYTMMSL